MNFCESLFVSVLTLYMMGRHHMSIKMGSRSKSRLKFEIDRVVTYFFLWYMMVIIGMVGNVWPIKAQICQIKAKLEIAFVSCSLWWYNLIVYAISQELLAVETRDHPRHPWTLIFILTSRSKVKFIVLFGNDM